MKVKLYKISYKIKYTLNFLKELKLFKEINKIEFIKLF
jgi:hypothetical protein